jgi:phage terminase small subunit
MSPLTPKQARFVEEYLKDLNATQASIRAGYSEKTANKQGPRLLENPAVCAAIDAAKVDRSEQVAIDAMWVLRRLVEEATADLADLYDPETRELRPIEDWPRVWREGLVQGIEVEELFEGRGEDRRQVGLIRKLRLSDRLRRTELIGKHVLIGAFQDIVKHTGFDDLADRLARASSREIEAVAAPHVLPAPTASPTRVDVREQEAEARRAARPDPDTPIAKPVRVDPLPPAAYAPILPDWPARQAFAAMDYRNDPHGLLGHRDRD